MKKKEKTKDGVNVRVSRKTHRALKEFTDNMGWRMTQFVDKAILNEIEKERNVIRNAV